MPGYCGWRVRFRSLRRPGDRVAILSRNVPEYIEIMNAVDARVLLVDHELLEPIHLSVTTWPLSSTSW